MIIVFLKDPQTIIKETPFIEQIEAKARLRSSQNMEINEAASNGFLAEVGIKSHHHHHWHTYLVTTSLFWLLLQ